MREITIRKIVLQKSNEQGGFYLMLLSKGYYKHEYQHTDIIISDYAIDHMDELYEDEDQPAITKGCPILSGYHVLRLMMSMMSNMWHKQTTNQIKM